MTRRPEVPAENLSPRWPDDARSPVPATGQERETLTATLDWYRQTFELKCRGVAPDRLSEKAISPSGISLHGLVRHLAAVERWWLQIRFAGADVPMLYYSDDDPDQDFTDLGGDVDEAFAVWHAECERSREIVAAASLDDTGTLLTGKPIALRRILVDMIAEYARHAGHADLLRECIDGVTGF